MGYFPDALGTRPAIRTIFILFPGFKIFHKSEQRSCVSFYKASLSCLVDPANKTVNGYITSYEPEYSKISPGVVSFGHAIKASIEKGYTTFDFAVGMDRYKLMFGPKKQKTKNVVIQRKGLRSTFPIATIKMIKGAGNSAKRVLTALKNKQTD